MPSGFDYFFHSRHLSAHQRNIESRGMGGACGSQGFEYFFHLLSRAVIPYLKSNISNRFALAFEVALACEGRCLRRRFWFLQASVGCSAEGRNVVG